MLIGDAVSSDSLDEIHRCDQAIKYFINRDVLAARQFLEAAKKKDPTLQPVDLLLAKMYFLGGNTAAGRARSKRPRRHSRRSEAAILLADQALGQGRIIESRCALRPSVRPDIEIQRCRKRKRNSRFARERASLGSHVARIGIPR